MKKYRLIKVTKLSGFVVWAIERKSLFWWEYVDSYTDQDKARVVLLQLQAGQPIERREVMDE